MIKVTQERQSKYRVNLHGLQALCGRNYLQILRWLPDEVEVAESWQVSGRFACLSVKLVEQTQYTQLLEIGRQSQNIPLLTETKFLVRVYHDAQLAEVLPGQNLAHVRGAYDYPNAKMYQPDEKYQMNVFLEELLKIDCPACLSPLLQIS